jgi:hypothetical protein
MRAGRTALALLIVRMTGVVERHSVRDWANVLLVANSMRQFGSSIDVEASVSLRVELVRPVPAAIACNYILAVEPLTDLLSGKAHSALPSRT